MTRYESVMSYLSTRNARTFTRLERERAGITVPIVAAGESVFVTTSPEIEQLVGQWRLLLTEDSEDGDMAQMRFADYAWRNRFGVPSKAALVFAEIVGEIDIEGDRRRFSLSIKPGPEFPRIVPGRRYLLHPAFTDFNTDRVIGRLREIDQACAASVTTVLTSPHSLLGPRTALKGPVRKEIERLLKRRERRDCFTASQLDALNYIIDNQLTLVWGPPGTGKTHFLALAVLTLLEAAARAGRPMRILVTAFTHAAIENCLRKIDSLREDLGMDQDDAPLVKLGPVYTQGCEGIDCIDRDGAIGFIGRNERCLVGGTVNKMQGQECEVVIVSYGLADPECAMIEGEFIYSLNRFNVAVTRAKSKCTVFVPRPLLKPCLSVLENPETAMDAGMMHKLEVHTAAGQALDFTVKCDMYPEGTRLAVYRQ